MERSLPLDLIEFRKPLKRFISIDCTNVRSLAGLCPELSSTSTVFQNLVAGASGQILVETTATTPLPLLIK